jgi:hypothetical protein
MRFISLATIQLTFPDCSGFSYGGMRGGGGHSKVSAADWEGAWCQTCVRGAITMITVAVLYTLLFNMFVWALPVMVGLGAAYLVYHNGAGEILAIIVFPITAILTFAAGRLAFQNTRSRAVRVAIALLFAVPAAIMGYSATLELVRSMGLTSVPWQYMFALGGGFMIGASAWHRLTQPESMLVRVEKTSLSDWI